MLIDQTRNGRSRVLHFAPSLPPSYSGAGKQAVALVASLSNDCNFEFHMACYMPEGENISDGNVSHVLIRNSLMGKIRQLYEVFRLIQKGGFDVIHVHGYVAAVLLCAALLRIPTVLKTTLEGVDDLCSIRKKGPIHSLISRTLDIVISLTPRMAQLNRSAEKSIIIPNGIQGDKYHFDPTTRDKMRQRFALSDTRQVFLFCGGDSCRKGFAELAETWSRICDFFGREQVALLIVGRFRAVDSLIKVDGMCQKFGNIEPICDVVDDLKPFLDCSDILLFLSSSEGLPNAVLEAAANGNVTYAKDIPGTYSHLLGDYKSVLFSEVNETNLANLRVKLEQTDRAATGLIDPGSIEINRVAGKYLEIYRQLGRV